MLLVRGVDGICAEHFTVESYTVFISQQSYLLLFGIPSPTHSLFPGLKPSFSANPSHCSPSFLLLKYLLRGFPGLFTVISGHICFLLLVCSVFTPHLPLSFSASHPFPSFLFPRPFSSPPNSSHSSYLSRFVLILSRCSSCILYLQCQ